MEYDVLCARTVIHNVWERSLKWELENTYEYLCKVWIVNVHSI